MLDIKQQCELALRALDAVVPIAEEAGIKTNPIEAYDEWDTVCQAIYEAFVTIPISDETGQYMPQQFHRLGFNVEFGRAVVTFRYCTRTLFLFDLSKASGGRMTLEARELRYSQPTPSICVPIEECSDFSVSKIISA